MAKKHRTEGIYHNVKEIKEFYDKEITKQKAGHANIQALDKYGQLISQYIKKNSTISSMSIKDLLEANRKVNTKNIFTKGADGQKLKWVNNEYSRKAMEKFIQMIMKNDRKKLEYYETLSKNNKYGKMQVKGVLNIAVPMVREATLEDGNKLKYNIDKLMQSLDKAKGFRHEDSAEFKKMKEALHKMNETMSSDYTKEEIGKQLEELQEASMSYIKAKGVGKQASGFGKKRMVLALSICNLSSDFMDVYASKERIQEIELNEKAYLGREALSQNGVLGYRRDNLGKYKESAIEKEEKVVEDDMEL